MSVDQNPKLLLLLERLLTGTQSGAIEWTQDDDFSFLYSGSSSSVSISSKDRDGNFPFEVRVFDELGNVIDAALSHEPRSPYSEREGAETFVAVYAAARRSALNVDPILDSLLSDVNARIDHAK